MSSLTALWSFWSPPYLASRKSSWADDWYHWLAWGLSLHCAGRHYLDTCLVTDTPGAHMLVDRLGLPFARVSTALDALSNADPDWWALGKLEAYRLQRASFVHIDTDVFLWHRLPAALEAAPIFSQNPEIIEPGWSCYRPDLLEATLGGAGWLPEEWRWYRTQPSPWVAACCGIFGGSRIDLIGHYAERALRLVNGAQNAGLLAGLAGKPSHMILPEQFLLSALLGYHQSRAGSPFRGVGMAYLFPDTASAWRPEAARERGFSHLAAGAKRDRRACRQIEALVRSLLPDFHARCCAVLGGGRPAAMPGEDYVVELARPQPPRVSCTTGCSVENSAVSCE